VVEMTENKDNPGIIMHPPIFYIAGIVAAIILDQFYMLPISTNEAIKIASIIPFSVGVLFFIFAVKIFRQNKQSPSVHATTIKIYQTGVYAYSRNPLYFGASMVMLSIALLFNNAWMLLMLILILFIMTQLVIKKEEIYLEHKFGEEYLEYKKKVRRWI
jgi:protein-S-isoprenylcysteine O-methyltransferase Ste14